MLGPILSIIIIAWAALMVVILAISYALLLVVKAWKRSQERFFAKFDGPLCFICGKSNATIGTRDGNVVHEDCYADWEAYRAEMATGPDNQCRHLYDADCDTDRGPEMHRCKKRIYMHGFCQEHLDERFDSEIGLH